MKNKSLIKEVKHFQKIAGILKEYIESDPETIAQAFQKAGIDLEKPVTYILDAGRGGADEPVKMLGSELLRKLEVMRAKGEANNPKYNQEEGVTYYFEPDGGEGPNFKLGVQFSDSLLYDIYQAKGITREDADYESISGDTATMGNINEAGAKWQSKLNPEVDGIEIYNDGTNRLFVIFDKNTGGIHVINDWNGEDFDEIWGTDGDVRPGLLAAIKKGSEMEDYHPDDPAGSDSAAARGEDEEDPEDFDDES